MIRVIKGTVGIVAKDGRRSTRTEKDGAFSLPVKEEERLVNLGVAAYYEDGVIGPKTGSTPVHKEELPEAEDVYPDYAEEKDAGGSPEGGESDGSGTERVDPDSDDENADGFDSMAFNDLRAFAKSMGISASGSREEILRRIQEASVVAMSAAQPQ